MVDAAGGKVITSFFTGQPIWDKISKGETLWGSPAVLEAGTQTAAIYGSFNGTVYILPLLKSCTLQAMVRSSKSLWIGLAVVAVVFLGIVLPIILTGGTQKI